MRLQLSGILFAVGLLSGNCALADDFDFSVADPRFKVTIPTIPQMKMEVHPLNKEMPHLRYLGSDGPYVVSILVPTSDSGMSPLECASSVVGSLHSRPGAPPQRQIYKARINERTFAALYFSTATGVMQLHAHFISAAAGSHCIEVHASKISTSKDDVEPWFKGFGGANIETY